MLDLLADAAAWLKAQGVDQWPRRFPRSIVTAAIEAGECFIATNADGRIVGTVNVTDRDERFWGDRDDALFVHRLAVQRSHAGLGKALLDWVDRRATPQQRDFVCLDCMADNHELRNYYRRLGFNEVGTLEGDGWKAALFERRCRTPAAAGCME